MFHALVIGCGNIGATYDLSRPDILTHVKGYWSHGQFTVTVFDLNSEAAEIVAGTYKCEQLRELTVEALSRFDCLSICTPTPSHLDYLSLAVKAEVPLILCEKPIAAGIAQLRQAVDLYNSGTSTVLVNFFRRFQPSYEWLKAEVQKIYSTESLETVVIRYHRGFFNNASHAFDIVQFLLGLDFSIEGAMGIDSFVDFTSDDPTISLFGRFSGVPIYLIGVNGISYSYFEIELLFKDSCVKIRNSGDVFELSTSAARGSGPRTIVTITEKKDCIKNPMSAVVAKCYSLLQSQERKDNFIESAFLQMRMLSIIEGLAWQN